MSQEVQLAKKVYGRGLYPQIIDINFNQLIPPTGSAAPNVLTIPEFFEAYDNLFYEIPLTGSINSHEYIAERSLTYAGVSLQGIYDELEFLRQENIQLKNQIVSTTFTNLTP